MKVEYKRQRNAKGILYTKWILFDENSKGIKSGVAKTQSRAEKRANYVMNEIKTKGGKQ